MFSCLVLILGFCALAAGQKVERNSEGYQIVKFDDGSWRYFQPSDSVYLNKRPSRPQPQTPAVSTEQLTINELVEKLALKAKFERDRYSNAQAKKLYLENQLDVAKQSPSAKQENKISSIKSDLELAKKLESDFKKRYKKAQKWADNGLDILHASQEKQLSFLKKYNKAELSETVAIRTEIESEERKPNHPEDKTRFARTSPAIDFISNPPSVTCQLDESYDQLTGVKRTDTNRTLLFEYSPEKLKPYLKGEPYVRAYSYLTSVRGYVLLNLEIVLSTDKASSSIGGIERNAEIIFQFLDGTRAVVNNRLATEGRIDPLKKNTSFLLQCEVNKNLNKVFCRELLDRIIINWKRGYEEYPIYDVDFFQRSFKCINDGV